MHWWGNPAERGVLGSFRQIRWNQIKEAETETILDDYRNRIRIGALLSRGITNPRLLEVPTELDKAITKVAGRVLQKSEKITFFFLYGCAPSWDEVIELLHRHVRKEYELATVKDYASEAETKIISEAEKAAELNEWETKFSKSQRKS